MGPERPLFAWNALIRKPRGDEVLKPDRELCSLRGRENQHSRRAARGERIDPAERDSKGRQRDLVVHDLLEPAAELLSDLSDEDERQVLLFRLDQSEPVRSAKLLNDLLLDERRSRKGGSGQLDGGEQTQG
jgi:hypothetical protein